MDESTAAELGAKPVVDVVDLTVTFPAAGAPVHALRGVSLALAPGEIVGLVGESGSGKSVLGLSILGLLPRRAGAQMTGRIELDGTEMVGASDQQRRARRGCYVSAVFQDPMTALNPSMRVGRQIAEAGAGLGGAEVVALMDAVGLPQAGQRVRSYPHELSGGQRQRVMIAMALARRPRLIVADEPTTALDVTVQNRVLELMSSAARERGAAILLVTHDLGVAAQVCDRVAVAYAGRIVELGPVSSMVASPRHPYTIGLLASRAGLDSHPSTRLATIGGRPPDGRGADAGCAFLSRCPLQSPRCAAELPGLSGDPDPVRCHHAGELAAWPHAPRPARVGPAPNPSALPVLRMTDVVREFRLPRRGLRPRSSLRAVGGVSLELSAGETLAVVGESGSGKTTLLRMAVGLLAPSAGSIVRGSDDRPQLIFQDAGASLTPWMSIGEQIGERLGAERLGRRERRRRVAEAVERVGLPADSVRQLPRMLSGGQRQRAVIARATIVPPRLLACDEPVSALDVSLAAQVLNLLNDLRTELGMAMLFVTHDLSAARAVAEQIMVMQDGVVVESGPAAQVLGEPRHRYTQELVAAVPTVARAAA